MTRRCYLLSSKKHHDDLVGLVPADWARRIGQPHDLFSATLTGTKVTTRIKKMRLAPLSTNHTCSQHGDDLVVALPRRSAPWFSTVTKEKLLPIL